MSGSAESPGSRTIVSGSYIEMYPGKPATPQRDFVGLDEPPALPPDTPGRSFTLLADDLGSLTRGSPISYRGMTVGEVEDYALPPGGKGRDSDRASSALPTRIWCIRRRVSGMRGSRSDRGIAGLRFRANSWEQLLSGGIAFETPDAALAKPPSTEASSFPPV